ncbi:MAG: hypothetical protein A2566_01655 [Candidatus Zambryskibacteria bacterium RIFOXYD1_FULL_40_13]|nr:MAG: hypothetical protein UT25_C0001G0030 [Parcubacteria group bacterium GW2011_GWC1_39_12]KKR19554.1 MAG: hypothetical protein UT49_C0001G0030 [Parcubacteria group bacterium GW2011_GWF1_39_37]KKR35707.1 MAG: hypothetical protein UT68_C0001G0030 [Parcubacteria group bacterium GW2011_GWC2_40_10]KKR52522.1 MAG: hypothetical protein UT89_C0001G0030 [Parcubacteria group bacterium GW2011_GWE1_40_20]KKR64811.1 MAG: hypothetical protein UU06_C0039G0005 [Parcubacteria group bacterium GW2011_GWB1_40_
MPDPFLVLAASFASSAVPQADADDSMAGATSIPSEVTVARRRAEQVTFVQSGRRKDWYWLLPDGTKVFHQ